MIKHKSIGVYIGRFQPFHDGHAHVIRQALRQVDHLIVFVGSSNRHSSIKNPFSFIQRKEMILKWFESNEDNDVHEFLTILPSNDNLYKEWQWKAGIVSGVKQNSPEDSDITLFGHSKDESSYYLKLFPEWNFVEVDNYHEVNATKLRESLFESGSLSQYVPFNVRDFLIEFKKTQRYKDLLEEWEFYLKEKDKFFDYPYPETLGFMCSDAVVVCMGHVLLVKRKHAPGKNTWALPGGFKERCETFLDGCVRELKEETNLRIPEKVLRGSIVSSNIFDDPSRTIGIPRVSMAYHIEVAPDYSGNLPMAKPASDAIEVKWWSLADISSIELFDDHRDIIDYFL